MLEKLGLPPKPSLRGNGWVVDASHCQGCSSQFTFINRKHHCRRCGGIFCGSCSQQRMVLRGQGDSPVRICEPCKKLEEAARFELRYGHKSRGAKGGSKHPSKKDDEILKDILGNEDRILSTIKTSASCSYILDGVTAAESGDIVRNLSLNPADMLSELESTTTPEDLRKQAVAEKSKYKTLKAEGKSEEALRAFKRGKELERQAGALEISLRKNRRKDDLRAPADKNKLPAKKSKETDDLSAELKDLGWSDQDLRDAEKRPATSVEGELSSLVREFSKKPKTEKATVSSDKSQVIAHKKRALELKRSGNLVEAKEELKRAKILERKIEEEELLGETDDSDDELSSLIRSMDGDDHDHDFWARHDKSDLNFDFSHFTGIADDLAVNGDFEVTDEDMYDPEINSALQSFGWMEDNTADSEDIDRESIVTEIQSLRREALNQKRAGNSAEAMALLKKAKLLEKELENSDTHETEDPFFSTGAVANDTALKTVPKSKLAIQTELLALKKKALSLRREGKLDESADELKRAKALEEQLEDMNKALSVGSKQNVHANTLVIQDEEEVTDQDLHDPVYLSLLKNLGWEDEDNNIEALSTTSKENNKSSKYMSDSAIVQSVPNVEIGTSGKSKSEIQTELLALKRKALTLRRQGEAEEADQMLKMAKLLEEKLNELNESTQVKDKVIISLEKPDEMVREKEKPYIHEPHSSPAATVSKPNQSSLQQEILAYKRKAITFKREGKLAEAKDALRQAKLLEKRSTEEDVPQTAATNSSDASSVDTEASPSSVSKPLSSRERFKLQQESLGHKRQALKLRREGRTAEADSEFEMAKAIEARLQESDAPGSVEPVDDVIIEDFLDPQLLSMLQSVGLDDGRASTSQGVESTTKPNAETNANAEREQLVERIKAEKVKAVTLKRSGKQAEALDALRRAKLYEKKLQNL
ncbi:vacuolar protein sorting-associated protein 27 [Phtheirospermum japonicum]|uniref:Vacuolar protein sorting-associated protein 27 n=1 Tax=Phtheirospermum japonicum TaxID=374723 RepID=A0A830CR50_9LAMI|nr:vacuolar protein sorting-associated protein 27 [Phtheirospermum japonicum]